MKLSIKGANVQPSNISTVAWEWSRDLNVAVTVKTFCLCVRQVLQFEEVFYQGVNE